MTVNYPAVGVFRRNGIWEFCLGTMEGKMLRVQVKIGLSDSELRKFHGYIKNIFEQFPEPPRPSMYRISLRSGSSLDWTWEGLQDVFLHVSRRVAQLDSGEPIPDSENYSLN